MTQLHQRLRRLDALESAVVRLRAKQHDLPVDSIRYGINLARIDVLPTRSGAVDLGGVTGRLRTQILRWAGVPERLNMLDLPALGQALIPLMVETRETLLNRFAMSIDPADLDAEVRHKALVVAAGGGGGSGYVHIGAFKLLDDLHLTPAMIVGTSMGSIIGLFRAHRRLFELDRMLKVAEHLRWQSVFGVPAVQNRFGLPATLRLFLRRALRHVFYHADADRVLRLDELEIPLRVVVAGLGRGGLAHEPNFYETLFADAARKGRLMRGQLLRAVELLREFGRKRARRIVLGGDALTAGFDALDAVGFSSAVPGIIHYDIWRDDPHMIELLEALFERDKLIRLIDGGVVSNVPARVAWNEVQKGAIGTRNAFILGLDAFAPNLRRNLMMLPIQQLIRPQVEAHTRYAGLVLNYRRVPSPLELVPSPRRIAAAMRDGYCELAHERGFLREMMRTLPPWRIVWSGC